MIKSMFIVGTPSDFAEKLNQKGLTKREIVSITAEKWDRRYLYTVFYEVTDEQEQG